MGCTCARVISHAASHVAKCCIPILSKPAFCPCSLSLSIPPAALANQTSFLAAGYNHNFVLLRRLSGLQQHQRVLRLSHPFPFSFSLLLFFVSFPLFPLLISARTPHPALTVFKGILCIGYTASPVAPFDSLPHRVFCSRHPPPYTSTPQQSSTDPPFPCEPVALATH